MTIERILGTDTGKEAFYKADRNFVALEKRPILNKAAAYTVVADDLNKTITVTGETTITLTAIATLGLGFRCRISNIGTGIISIAPSGTDTIATGTGITIYPGKCVEVVADYAGMWTVVGFDFTEVVNSLGAQINDLATYKGCAVRKTANQSIPNGDTVTTILTFGEAIYGNFFNISNPSRLTIPANVSKVKVIGSVTFAKTGVGFRNIQMMKNGAAFNGRGSSVTQADSNASITLHAQSIVIDVVEGDYFELTVTQNSGSSIDVFASTTTWFEVEVVA